MNALVTNPNMSKAKAMAYLDTVMHYLNPRIVMCLNPCTTVGIKEIETPDSQIAISPNPASDHVQIEIKSDDKIFAIDIFDLAGRKVFLIPVTEMRIYNIEMQKLSPGNYFIRFQSANGVTTKKLLIQ